jgi:CubicO group peptidase (beta-lactamase class C family)
MQRGTIRMQNHALSESQLRQLDDILLLASAPHGPGAAALVALGDTTVYRRAFGLANVENAVPLSPDCSFRIGSITKVFTSAALLQLCDQGRVALSDPLQKFVPSFPNAADISIAQLLNHSSGISGYNLAPDYMSERCRTDMTTAQLLQSFMHLPPDFAPGEQCKYSNSGFVLVGAVLEAITGRHWHEVVLDMLSTVPVPHTVFGRNERLIPGMAEGYSSSASRQLQRSAFISMTQVHAAGALVSRLDDLLAFSRVLHCGGLLQPTSYAAMTAPSACCTAMGLGMKMIQVQGLQALGHDGQVPGFSSMMLYLPSHELTVVVLSNSDRPPADPNAVARRLAACIIGNPYVDAAEVSLTPQELLQFEGCYRALLQGCKEQQVCLAVESDRLCFGGQSLRYIGSGCFILPASLLHIEFVSGTQPLQLRLLADDDCTGVLWQRVSA